MTATVLFNDPNPGLMLEKFFAPPTEIILIFKRANHPHQLTVDQLIEKCQITHDNSPYC